MAGAAKGNMGGGRAIKVPEMSMKKWEPSSTMSINLKKHNGMDDGEVGDKVHFRGHGKIVSIHKDDMGHTMGLDIHKIEPDGDMDEGNNA